VADTPITFCEAIARREGWLVPTSRCRRNHNPGNIEFGNFARAHGATHGDPRFAVFPDDKTGFEAMSALLIQGYANLTVAQAIAKWAPPIENDTESYIENVCTWTGLTQQTELTIPLLNPPQNA
jgi:hypothetical protein